MKTKLAKPDPRAVISGFRAYLFVGSTIVKEWLWLRGADGGYWQEIKI